MSKIEDSLCEKIQGRAAVGLKKYGVSLERTDLSYLDWLVHAQEEACDFAAYLEKLITIEKERIELGQAMTEAATRAKSSDNPEEMERLYALARKAERQFGPIT